MGRKPRGPRLAEHVEASERAKRRLAVILETVAGQKTVAQACAELGIEESAFHAIRSEALQAAAASLEPGRVGRPPKIEDAKVSDLERKLVEARIELEAARLREEIAVFMPHLLKRSKAKKKPRR
jgi:hypothetical protein